MWEGQRCRIQSTNWFTEAGEASWPASAAALGSAQAGLAGAGRRMQGRTRAAPVLVGRDGELGELLAGLDDAASGSGRLFLLAGDPGVGKSRLAYEAAERARGRGFKVAWGRGWEGGGGAGGVAGGPAMPGGGRRLV